MATLVITETHEVDLDVNIDHIVTEDDTPVDNILSEKQQRLLTEPLYSSWAGPEGDTEEGKRRPFLIAANVGLFPAVHQPAIVPDVFLSLDVQVPPDFHEKRHRTYFFWEFGKAPEVVIEIVSNREGHELESKRRDYARIGIGYYVVYDPLQQLGEQLLYVFERRGGGTYEPRTDHYFSEIGLGVTLWEGVYEDVHQTWLRWCDEQGVVIPTGAERAAQEADRAQREAERAQREADRATRLAAKLRELGVNPDEL